MTAVGLAALVPAAAPASAAPSAAFPTTIQLPNGFQPEGIATGIGTYAYFGSRGTGVVYRVDLRTGAGKVITEPTNTPSLGMKTDARGRLFVAGGTGGDGRVYDGRSGRLLAQYRFATTPPNTFVNDVILTDDAAWFTDSNRAVLYKVPFGRHGRLPAADGFETLALTGAYQHVDGAVNLNGIARTPDGKGLLVVQSNLGFLFRVDPRTGVTTQVDLGGVSVARGDGLLLLGRTLYVVQNRDNLISVFTLNKAGTAGTKVKEITDTRFDIPTTVAAFGNRLYLPNARFGVADPGTVPYNAVAVDK
ncbi:superoxide dismutase [Virgisporangium aliadipatigenens]|uniref:superoxide dismutase n=1 Tax=Virgisporangium aliadipatigenens TaxID=741659 RepID=UPI001EF3B85C|nr:superoxide dismutase [Virgisporangium aliadipatigenens]